MPEQKSVKLRNVEVEPNYVLVLTFETGEKKRYDFAPNFEFKVFQPLRNPALFKQAKNRRCGVVWNESLDIAAEELYLNGVPLP